MEYAQLPAEAIPQESAADQDTSAIPTENGIPNESIDAPGDLPLHAPENPSDILPSEPPVLRTSSSDSSRLLSSTIIENSPHPNVKIELDQEIPLMVADPVAVGISELTTSPAKLTPGPIANSLLCAENHAILTQIYNSNEGSMDHESSSIEQQHVNFPDPDDFTAIDSHIPESVNLSEIKRSRSLSILVSDVIDDCSGSKSKKESRSCKRRSKEDQAAPSCSKRPRKRKAPTKIDGDNAAELSSCSISTVLTAYPELPGLVIETLAMSRASSQTIPVLCNGLLQNRPTFKEERARKDWELILHEILEGGRRKSGVFEKIESRGRVYIFHITQTKDDFNCTNLQVDWLRRMPITSSKLNGTMCPKMMRTRSGQHL
jgi:hypothetical protein